MKKTIFRTTIITLSCCLLLFGCQSEPNNSSSQDNSSSLAQSNSFSSSSLEESSSSSIPPVDSASSSAIDNPSSLSPEVDLYSKFSLGPNGTVETVAEGDSVGDWTLDDLEISLDNDELNMLSADFVGSVELTGNLELSPLIEDSYSFVLSNESKEQIPFFHYEENAPKEEIYIELDIPEEIKSTLTLTQTDSLPCKITLTQYHFTFAYMMAPTYGTISSLELIR